MNSKEFIGRRICVFAGEDFDPDVDAQVIDVLWRKFYVRLPQRRSLDDSLAATTSDHEIISLIIKYRTMK